MSVGLWTTRPTKPDDHEEPEWWREGEWVVLRDAHPVALTDDENIAKFIVECCNLRDGPGVFEDE